MTQMHTNVRKPSALLNFTCKVGGMSRKQVLNIGYGDELRSKFPKRQLAKTESELAALMVTDKPRFRRLVRIMKKSTEPIAASKEIKSVVGESFDLSKRSMDVLLYISQD